MDNDPRTNTDNENNRFGREECVVLPPVQVQLDEGSIRDVIPQPVDSELNPVADWNNNDTENIYEDTRTKTDYEFIRTKTNNTTTIKRKHIIITKEQITNNSTQSLSPVPTAVGIDETSSVGHTTAVGTVGQDVPQVSPFQRQSLALCTAAPYLFSDQNSPGEGPSTRIFGRGIYTPSNHRSSYATQSLSPVPATVGISGDNSVVFSTVAGTVGHIVPQVSPFLQYRLTVPTAESFFVPDTDSLKSSASNQVGEEEKKVASPSHVYKIQPGEDPYLLETQTSQLSTSESLVLSHHTTTRYASTASISSSDSNNRASRCFALQWNIRGLRANINELKQLISIHNPCVVALQETKVNQRNTTPDFIGKNYTLLLEENRDHYWQHGVGLAIRDGIPFEQLNIDTPLQVVAVRIHKPFRATIVSMYIPPSAQQCQSALNDLFDHIDSPVVFLGDFNAHHLAWGSQSTNQLGRFIAEATLTRKLVILNDCSATRIDPATGNTSAIDISLCSATIARKLSWRTVPDTCNSDHFPIVITVPEWLNAPTTRKKWLFDKADWALYERITATQIRPDEGLDIERFTEKVIEAATEAIPQSSGLTGPKRVPWWCPEVREAIKRRRKCLRILRRMESSNPGRLEALKRFQDSRAAARKAVKTAKQRSWENFVVKISPNSSTTELWRSVNTMRGGRRQRALVLKRGDGFTDNPVEVAEKLSEYYSEISATSSYPSLFQKRKEIAERQCLDLSQDTDDVYNFDISLHELLWALDKGQSVSTGPDHVGYPMLQRLPISVKTTLLELLNKTWRSGEFPTCWRTAIVIPIPKSNCKDSGPAAFRPISLTSCMAKVLERIINRRLITELETNGRLDKRQHAFRSGHGADTYFAELGRILPTTDEHCLIASLDLSKAYDTTWRHGILRTLRSWKVRGRMFNILHSFLSERLFQVCVGGHLSSPHVLENGVPQGSVLSVTLFLAAIQPIFKVVPNGVEVLLYADDILLVVRGRKSEALHKKLQAAVTAVVRWAKSVGFSVSAAKSSTFYCSPNARRNPARSISIDRVPVPYTNRLRVLGVTLDRTLTFKAHCKLVKELCESRLRVLRAIGAHLPRGQRTTLLQVGSAIVTSRLVYGIGLVSRGGQAALQILAPVYNRMIRYASGAFVTSPINSIMAEAGTLPFELLAIQTTIRIAIRLLAYDRNNNCLPLIQRALEQFHETTGSELPAIQQILRLNNREWHTPKPNIIWDVKRLVKAGDAPDKVRPVVQQLLSNQFLNATVVYTDGSKAGDSVGAGLYSNGLTMSRSLPNQCSVFSAEAQALKMATAIPNVSNLVILTDSASCLMALEGGQSKHPWIQEVEHAARTKNTRFCWIPGHAGIRGNEEADRLANEARFDHIAEVPIPAEDALRYVKNAVKEKWSSQWFAEKDAKLREVKYDTSKWTDQANSGDQRALTRLRIGHTRLTHSFLLKKETPPICDSCGIKIDVRHLLLHCRKYENERKAFGIDTTSLRKTLCNIKEEETKLLNFMKKTNLYKKL